uniref:Uncharacterized protein n=1 Tax=Aplanochytrium stocchinoi TaxID=215587 RepID=A0A7S3LLY4_9STRA|mmetsp:Transcript_17843/g.22751  ORF Transcript_17843/g.22751 Transcript_17843/m.22751 type:complete len:443 (+) Transcript_17843:300-1628(+)
MDALEKALVSAKSLAEIETIVVEYCDYELKSGDKASGIDVSYLLQHLNQYKRRQVVETFVKYSVVEFTSVFVHEIISHVTSQTVAEELILLLVPHININDREDFLNLISDELNYFSPFVQNKARKALETGSNVPVATVVREESFLKSSSLAAQQVRNSNLDSGQALSDYKLALDSLRFSEFPEDIPDELASMGVLTEEWRQLRSRFSEIRGSQNAEFKNEDCAVNFFCLSSCGVLLFPCFVVNQLKLEKINQRIQDELSVLMYEHGLQVRNKKQAAGFNFEELNTETLYSFPMDVLKFTIIGSVKSYFPENVPRLLAEVGLTPGEWNEFIEILDRVQMDSNVCYKRSPYCWAIPFGFPGGCFQCLACMLIFDLCIMQPCGMFPDTNGNVKREVDVINEKILKPHGICMKNDNQRYVFQTMNEDTRANLLAAIPKVQIMNAET